ncbi:T9SS type A sorting domain-containing protein [bacterium]|nr:T9SS type A sorting domain-containing protein [bacterium]
MAVFYQDPCRTSVSFLDFVKSGIRWVQEEFDEDALGYLDSGMVDEAYTQVRRGVVQLGATANSISDAEERLELDSQSAQQARQRVDTAQVLLNNAKNHIAQARINPNEGLLNSAKQLIENADFKLAQALSILEGSAAPTIVKTVSKELRFSKGIPVKSELVQNYPNPFNPETWIPYNLSKDADVIIKIYNVSGQLIRTLDLDHKDADFYLNKDKAAYWNGRDNLGEKVASGIYFYTLKAGDFRATRRMLIMK